MGAPNWPYNNGPYYATPANVGYDIITDATGQAYYRFSNGSITPIGQATAALKAEPLPLPVEKREMPVVGYRGWNWATKFRIGYGKRGTLTSTRMQGFWKS